MDLGMLTRGHALNTKNSTSNQEITFAFVGCVAPNATKFHNEAFSRAGQMFQEGLLVGLKNAGLPTSLVLAAAPVPSWPRSRKLWIRGEDVRLRDEIPVRLVSFPNITPIKQLSIGMNIFWQLLKWGWRTRRRGQRVVYTYNLTVPPGLFTLAGARITNTKAIVSINDINVPGETVPNTMFNRLDFWLQRKLIPRFDGHVVVADMIMHDFAPGRPYLRLEGGINESQVASDHSSSRKSARGEFTIVFAGSLDPVNGVDILLDAFSQLRDSNYRLLIAGCGPQEGLVERAVANDQRIQFLGLLPFAELLKLYSSADLLVSIRPTKALQTRYFFPSKTMEFLASGTPVLATCTGHTEEEFGNICYLFKEETPEALACKIREIAAFPPSERQSLGQRARAYMKANKTWVRQGERLISFMHDAVLKECSS